MQPKQAIESKEYRSFSFPSIYETLTMIMGKYGVLIALFILLIIAGILSDVFFTLDNILNILRQVSANGIIAVGMTFVILTGGIDISVGSMVGVVSVLFAALFNPSKVENLHWLVVPFSKLVPAGQYSGVVVAVIFLSLYGLLMGLINGAVITKGKIQPFILTIGALTIYRGLALVFPNGKPIYFSNEDADKISFLGDGEFLHIPIPVIVFLVIVILASLVLNHTTFGRYVRAIGGNEEAARVAGIKIHRYKMAVYAICGFLAAIAAIVTTARTGSGEPNLGNQWELDAIAAVVIGGTRLTGGVGTIFGSVIGAIIIGVINNLMNLTNVSAYYQFIVKGLIIVLAVLMRRKEKS